MSVEKIKRLRELVKEVARGAYKEHSLHIPPDYEHDADLVISWAADHIEELEEVVDGKTSYTRNGVIYKMQMVERRTEGRRKKDQ
ncbi:MAG: hypothetical protein ACERKJ_12170 [Candidatus Dadabacteria bacterium]